MIHHWLCGGRDECASWSTVRRAAVLFAYHQAFPLIGLFSFAQGHTPFPVRGSPGYPVGSRSGGASPATRCAKANSASAVSARSRLRLALSSAALQPLGAPPPPSPPPSPRSKARPSWQARLSLGALLAQPAASQLFHLGIQQVLLPEHHE